MRRIEIVSHPLCPHTHRLVMIATAGGWVRGREYSLVYLPYGQLQQTVPKHSPTGELPVLKLDGNAVTSTSVHAAEYLDSIAGLGLLPSDPELRIAVREREKKAGALLDTMRMMFAGPTREVVEKAVAQVFLHLQAFNADLEADGTDELTMRMDMAALEPALSLLTFFPALRDDRRWDDIPYLRDIARRSAENPIVRDSLCPNYGWEFEEFFKMTGSAFPAIFLGR